MEGTRVMHHSITLPSALPTLRLTQHTVLHLPENQVITKEEVITSKKFWRSCVWVTGGGKGGKPPGGGVPGS